MLNAEMTLTLLLNKLMERQSYCPYCSGEKVHDSNCILIDLWFDYERGHIPTHWDD